MADQILPFLLEPVYYDELGLIYTLLALFGLTLILHVWCLCKDPGFLKSPKGVPFMEMMKIFDPVLLCADCEVVRTDRSRHCSICNRCVERFDHHCPWINNCVGLNNHGIFMCFLVSMLTLLVATFVTTITHFRVYQNRWLPRTGTGKWLYEDLFLPDFFYDKTWIIIWEIICLMICGVFILLVL